MRTCKSAINRFCLQVYSLKRSLRRVYYEEKRLTVQVGFRALIPSARQPVVGWFFLFFFLIARLEARATLCAFCIRNEFSAENLRGFQTRATRAGIERPVRRVSIRYGLAMCARVYAYRVRVRVADKRRFE